MEKEPKSSRETASGILIKTLAIPLFTLAAALSLDATARGVIEEKPPPVVLGSLSTGLSVVGLYIAISKKL